MAYLIEIKIESSAVEAVLRSLEAAGWNMTPAFRGIAVELLSLTEKRFADEGPGWERSERAKRDGGKTLRDSGQLAAVVDTDYGSHHALIGNSKVYAAIHKSQTVENSRSRVGSHKH